MRASRAVLATEASRYIWWTRAPALRASPIDQGQRWYHPERRPQKTLTRSSLLWIALGLALGGGWLLYLSLQDAEAASYPESTPASARSEERRDEALPTPLSSPDDHSVAAGGARAPMTS